MFNVVLFERSFPSILRYFSVRQTPKYKNSNFDKIMQRREKIYVYLPNTSHLYIFNQFAKRNETFIIRLINTGGTSGQNLTILISSGLLLRHFLNYLSLNARINLDASYAWFLL